MRYPNKVTSFKESILFKMTLVLEALNDCTLTVEELYKKVRRSFESTADFIETLDALYALDKIKIQKYSRRIEYVG